MPGNLYSGISKVPSTLPLALDIKGLPATIVVSPVYVLDAGVTNELTFCPSKNTYNLVFGKKFSPVNDITLGLIKGIRALDITLVP